MPESLTKSINVEEIISVLYIQVVINLVVSYQSSLIINLSEFE